MPAEQNDSNPLTRQITDVIAESEKVRDGLHDDEALPLIDWGTAQAKALGAKLAAPETPDVTPEQAAETGYALARLMTRITWVVTYRSKKDADWLTRTFHKINDLSRELHGLDAPTLSDEEIAAWIAEQPGHTNAELIQGLTARLTPGTPSPSDNPDTPGASGDSGTPDVPGVPGLPSAPPHFPGSLPGRGDPHEQESIDE
ncbi:hypothetical protein [Aggregatilinea lenta]|uniref:hypothetical protein n=1 Tax=Aggregatilinea lenta TaxID=913108 RepID=UPI000E5C1DED|nr:hypothetical protein [Aggregatilinea lenta]